MFGWFGWIVREVSGECVWLVWLDSEGGVRRVCLVGLAR